MPRAAEGGGEPHTSGLRGLCCKLTMSRCSLRVGRGASGGETPALLGQRISKRSPSTCTMFAMKQQDPDSKEQGESKASLPTAAHGWQRACRGSLRAAKTGGRGRQELPSCRGTGSLLSSASGGPGWAVGTCWGTGACHAPFFSKGPSPALQPARQGQSRPLQAIPQGHLPQPHRGAHSQWHLFSPPQCACCVTGQRLTRPSVGAKKQRKGSVPTRIAW